MFFKNTVKKFFIEDGSHDLFCFIFGLVFLFIFTFFMMPKWIFCLGIGVLTSSIFRYITTDGLFYKEFKNLDNRNKRFDYILSKNIFTLLFLSGFVLLLYFLVNVGERFAFTSYNNFNFKLVFYFIIYILATENIILIFSHRMVPNYKSGKIRNTNKDIEVGINNLKAMIPSLLLNIILLVLIFIYRMNLTIVAGIFYLFVSTVVFSINKRLSS
ncbi:hypothetical protein [uncultured Anaerococcus sp.]|uniref:hypothetical protein n=1 Tax=uncultured Anaerococcus sp. TaxID=293428 RepID=UPI0025FCCEE9|nr:hypothetical protein [uncultured Anaerococcus sp.]